MLHEVKPRNPRAARAIAQHQSLTYENPKRTLLLRSSRSSAATQLLLRDLHTLLTPQSIRFHKKNQGIHPFDNASSLEFFSRKNDASLVLFASHNKKRPHCLTLLRTFGHETLDMLELLLDDGTLRTLSQFKGRKPAVGLQPLIVFAGTPFESPAQTKYTLVKSLLLDLFKKGPAAETRETTVDVEGLQYVVCVSAADEVEGQPPPQVHLRAYMLRTTRVQGTRLPRVDVEEMGPRADFRLGREQFAEEGRWKEAMKRPKEKGVGAGKKNKNVEADLVGDKMGRIHVGKQDLSGLQTRKMRGLKRGRDEDVIADVNGMGVDGEGEADAKKARV